MTSSHYHDCIRQASLAHRNGRHREAALDFERAKNEAMALGAAAAAFKATVWAAFEWTSAGRPLRAYELLAEALTDPPPDRPNYEYWIALTSSFQLRFHWRPERWILVGMLERLVAERTALCAPPQDVPILQATYARACGDFVSAIGYCEHAYAKQREDVDGFTIHSSLYNLCLDNLRLGDGGVAARWVEILEKTETHYSASRIYHSLATGHLALWNDWRGEFPALRGHCVDLSDRSDDPDDQNELAEMQARLLLLIDRGDPAAALHPARGPLRRRASGRRPVSAIHRRPLFLVDYRLAELRYAASLPACDDHWHRHPSSIAAPLPCPLRRGEVARRLDKARRAVHRAAAYARWLDGCWETDFRQSEVAARGTRIEAIAAALPSA